MEIDEVQAAINEAFEEMPIPRPRSIIRRVDHNCREGAEKLRKDLGKVME